MTPFFIVSDIVNLGMIIYNFLVQEVQDSDSNFQIFKVALKPFHSFY